MRILGVDLGHARTGLALSDESCFLASPLGVEPSYNWDKLLLRIVSRIQENRVQQVVVGLPRNMDGTEGASAQGAREFAEKLQTAAGVPVTLWDERGTTITAHGYLNESNVRGKKRKSVVDAVAATIILQGYLDHLRQMPPKA
ncbi:MULTISPECIES: Holliday junction resolvase RuvX [Caproicibacterium]|jgi:putative Holliday junction resolvase|uniref:Putative pre-16S rRNA nuclease n=1 Tax=Caproicibacterium lactatifermentans TaxID=2666138 RepID=A0A859DS10_9FIRM|nr:Holliday junction resolvase RuvX [Caproicibacterium lactatifermentans]ARP49808.1 Holliday junction resolvase RuvX [Ruminococcaceae bacterium CPB6]MDD4807073.1 Holliday junction resolvase RuvX [Oscillospiraceae bacterium]QKN24464.1 Holliday junction resolvase RuvX [Caproicibacterium lactatifermentans]QKO30523.1 Holliday junction resolvase RuvX [Caproicibacterium lactatifermentans]